jgi:hypothetical protein
MTNTPLLACDGCGQPATSEHIAKRLQRLEWTTRYRPIHIGTVLLGAFAPTGDAEFLYAEAGTFAGEARDALFASGISPNGKTAEATLSEFQRRGFLLTYVLECPLNPGVGGSIAIQALLQSRLPAWLARVRRSLRPRRVVPISRFLEPLIASLKDGELGCPLVLDSGKPFALDADGSREVAARLSQALAASPAAAR